MILITEFMDEGAVARLRERYSVDYRPGLADSQGELPSAIAGKRALVVRNRTIVDKALLGCAPDLACVGRLGVGLDNIDQEECARRGIAVFPATGANANSVAEYVIASSMALLRKAYSQSPRLAKGEWSRESAVGREIAGKRLGLVGFGGTARVTARLALALGMRVDFHDPFQPERAAAPLECRNLPLGELFAESCVVSVHAPLSEQTRGMVGEALIGRMRPGAILVNASRGGIVDERAVAEALREGRLAGAALDVFEAEPITMETAAMFRGLDNVILTPHIAGVTRESNLRVSGMIADKVIEFLGESP